MNKITVVLLGLVISVFLVGCSIKTEEEIQAEKQSYEDLKNDKQVTYDRLKVEEKNKLHFEELKNRASQEQLDVIEQELVSSEVSYSQLKNLGKEVENEYTYIFVVKNDDKFKELYQHVILELGDVYEEKILVYFPEDKKEGVSFPTNRTNIEVKYKGEDVQGLDNVSIEYTPTFIAKNEEGKVYLTLLGTYDYNVLLDKITSFGKIEGIKDLEKVE